VDMMVDCDLRLLDADRNGTALSGLK
jgi:hypothetical protein